MSIHPITSYSTSHTREYKATGWTRFMNKYIVSPISTMSTNTPPVVTAEQLTRRPSKLRRLFTRHNAATAPSEYMINSLNVGSPTGFRHEGGLYYVNDPYKSMNYAPAPAPPVFYMPPEPALKRSSSAKTPRSSSNPIHTRSRSISGVEHLVGNQSPGTYVRRRDRENGPAVPPKESEETRVLKKVRWADSKKDAEENEQQQQPQQQDASNPDRHRRLSHKTRFPERDTTSQEHVVPWHQHDYSSYAPQPLASGSAQAPRYTIPRQHRKPVPYHSMPPPFILAESAPPASSSALSPPPTRRRSVAPTITAGAGAGKSVMTNQADNEADAECKRLVASIEEKRQRRMRDYRNGLQH